MMTSSTVSLSRKSRHVRVCPYVGLVPFTEEDAEYFAGRAQEAKVVFSNLCASQLTVFFGSSGVGKSSLLQAGVVPLVRQSRACGAIVYFRAWQSSHFSADLKTACVLAAKQNQPDISVDPRQPLDTLLAELAAALRRPIFVLLDQFEDYLLFRADSPEGKEFEPELASAINDDQVAAHFLIGIRDDALSKLDRLDMRIPNLLSNTLRLRPVTREGADAALRDPLTKYNENYRNGQPPITIGKGLAEEILSNISPDKARFADAADGSGKSVPPDKAGSVELAFLQLVMTRLWETESNEGSLELRRSTLVNRLGGTAAVVRTYIDKLMRAFTEGEQRVCARIFHVLVTSSGNKIAYTAEELLEHSRLPLDELTRLLEKLTRVGILRELPHPEGEEQNERRFEIQHDRLAAAVLDWRKRFVTEQQIESEQRELKRRLWRWLGGGALCALVVAGLAFLSYRTSVTNAALREMQALVIAPKLLDAANAARARAATTRVTPRNADAMLPEEDRERRLLRQVGELYRTTVSPNYHDKRVKDRIDAPLTLPESKRYLDFQSVSALTFSADGSMIAVGTDDGQIAIVPRDARRQPMYAPTQAGGILALGFRSPSRPVAVRRGPAEPRSKNLPRPRAPAAMGRSPTESRPDATEGSPTEPQLGAAKADTLTVFETSGTQPKSLEVEQFKTDAKPGNDVAFLDGDANRLAVLGSDNYARIYDLPTERRLWRSATPRGDASSLALVTRGKETRLAYTTVAGQLMTVSPRSQDAPPEELRSFRAIGRTLIALASNSPDFAFATAHGHEVSWWANAGAPAAIPLVPRTETRAPVRKLAVSADGKRVAAVREGGLVSVWHLASAPTLTFELELAFPRFEAAFSSDLSCMAVFANQGLFVYKLDKPQPLPPLAADHGLHADEYLLAVGDFVPGIKAGFDAASSGRLTEATKHFTSALRLKFPGISFNPRDEVLRTRMSAIGEQLMKQVLDAGDVSDVQRTLEAEIAKAGADASELSSLAPLVNPVMAQAHLKRAVRRLVEPKKLAVTDRAQTYLDIYSDLKEAEKLNPSAPVPAVYWNNVCWFGTIVGLAEALVDAGERAVELAPTDAGIRDTRALSRACSGNTSGAILDYRFAIQDSTFVGQSTKADIELRKAWLDKLSTGGDACTKTDLDRLLNE